eukprot:695274-Amphidinium_carterae.1
MSELGVSASNAMADLFGYQAEAQLWALVQSRIGDVPPGWTAMNSDRNPLLLCISCPSNYPLLTRCGTNLLSMRPCGTQLRPLVCRSCQEC